MMTRSKSELKRITRAGVCGNKKELSNEKYHTLQSDCVSSNTRKIFHAAKNDIHTCVHTPKWTKEEDMLLIKLCSSKINRKWLKISNIIGSKNPSQCAYRFKRLGKEGKIFSSQEGDDILLNDEKIFGHLKKSFDNKEKNNYKEKSLNFSPNVSRKKTKRNSFIRNKSTHRAPNKTSKKNSAMEESSPCSPCSELQEGFILTEMKSSSTNLIHLSSVEGENLTQAKTKQEFSFLKKPSIEDNNFAPVYAKSIDAQMFNNKMKSASHASQICFHDYQLKKDSADFFSSTIFSKNKEASNEFKREFIKNFDKNEVLENEPDHDFFMTKSENIQKISQIKAYLETETTGNFQINYAKLWQLLTLTHYISNGHATRKEELRTALVLQAEILQRMIAMLESKIGHIRT